MEMTWGRISFIFDPRDMLLSLQIDSSFVRVAEACAILESIQFLSFHFDLPLDAISADLHPTPCAGFDETDN